MAAAIDLAAEADFDPFASSSSNDPSRVSLIVTFAPMSCAVKPQERTVRTVSE